MKEHFFNEKHKNLYKKFLDKKQKYLMILGGASEEDANNFSIEEYKQVVKKTVLEMTKRDSKLSELALNGMEGSSVYDKIPFDKRLLYCRVLDNIHSKSYNFKNSPKGDPVYDALINLYKRIEKIHEEQFEPFLNHKNKKDDLEEAENAGKYDLEFDSKKSFIKELIYSFEKRGPVNGKWEKDSNISEERYNFLLKNLVNSTQEEREKFEKEFVGSVPMFAHEGFYFWPDEEKILTQ